MYSQVWVSPSEAETAWADVSPPRGPADLLGRNGNICGSWAGGRSDATGGNRCCNGEKRLLLTGFHKEMWWWWMWEGILQKRQPITQKVLQLNGNKRRDWIWKQHGDHSAGRTGCACWCGGVCVGMFPLIVCVYFLFFLYRIAGDTALCKNIHESVSRQMRKNFAKSKWRVCETLHLIYQRKTNKQTKKMQCFRFFLLGKKKKQSNFCFAPSPLSKRSTRQLWSVTWGVCSSAPASEAASKAPSLRRVLRAERRPRASLWTAPRCPWRTVSDSADASCDQNRRV